ncbi:MAG: cupin domain-containing protein [Gemmatimonadales bacterium]
MLVHRIGLVSALIAPAALLASCSDDSTPPTAAATEVSAAVVSAAVVPFTVRAPLDPFKIQALPDFLMHSKVRSDIVMQQLVFPVGTGGWHTHPGASFVYVLEGAIKLQRYDRKTGCTESPVFVAGQAYSEEPDEIHRSVVVSAVPAVLLVTRFNIPIGGALSTPVPNPGC